MSADPSPDPAAVDKLAALERRVNRYEEEVNVALGTLSLELRRNEVVGYLLIGCVVLLTFLVYKNASVRVPS